MSYMKNLQIRLMELQEKENLSEKELQEYKELQKKIGGMMELLDEKRFELFLKDDKTFVRDNKTGEVREL